MSAWHQLYDEDFIGRALRGQTTSVSWNELSFLERFAVRGAQVGMLVGLIAISIPARLPFVASLVETCARIYGRNAFGYFLRGAYYKNRLRKMGQNVLIDMGAYIWFPQNVEVGDNSHIDTNVMIYGGSPGHGYVRIGRYVHVPSNCIIGGRGGVTIEDYAGLAAGCYLYSGSNYYQRPNSADLISMSSAAPEGMQYVIEKPIIIEEYAFLGMHTAVLPGVRVGRGAVVGAGSVVTRDVPPFSVAVGAPAKVIHARPQVAPGARRPE